MDHIRRRIALGVALTLTLVTTGSAFALSQGALLSNLEPACTLNTTCEEADGVPDDVCSVGTNNGVPQFVVVTGFGFNLPSSVTSIDGVLVEAKVMTTTGCAPTLQLQAPALAGMTRALATPPTSTLCADSEFRSAGGATDTWGVALAVVDINDYEGFGVRINRCADTGVDAVRMTIFFTIGTPVCGDGYQTGDEQCDDGNTDSGDGCSATCDTEGALDKDAQACVNVTNKNAVKLVATVGKLATTCVTAASKGNEPDPDACLANDEKGTVAKAAAKLAGDDAKKCASGAAFGYTSAATAAASSDAGMRALVHDVYGPTLTGVIGTAGVGKCQVAVLSSLQKILKAKTNLFLTCKKNGLKGKPQLFQSSGDLESCFDPLIDDTAGMIAKAVTSLQETVEKKCAAVPFASGFPGTCAGAGDAAALAACIDRRVECRTCQVFNGVDGLARSCDLVDDGTANASCS
jgi:cysteine-rich repeat protein